MALHSQIETWIREAIRAGRLPRDISALSATPAQPIDTPLSRPDWTDYDSAGSQPAQVALGRTGRPDEIRSNRPPIGTVRIVPSLIRRRMVLVLTRSHAARSSTVCRAGSGGVSGSCINRGRPSGLTLPRTPRWLD